MAQETIDFIGEDEDIVLPRELDDLSLLVGIHAVSCGVVWTIDHNPNHLHQVDQLAHEAVRPQHRMGYPMPRVGALSVALLKGVLKELDVKFPPRLMLGLPPDDFTANGFGQL